VARGKRILAGFIGWIFLWVKIAKKINNPNFISQQNRSFEVPKVKEAGKTCPLGVILPQWKGYGWDSIIVYICNYCPVKGACIEKVVFPSGYIYIKKAKDIENMAVYKCIYSGC